MYHPDGQTESIMGTNSHLGNGILNAAPLLHLAHQHLRVQGQLAGVQGNLWTNSNTQTETNTDTKTFTNTDTDASC